MTELDQKNEICHKVEECYHIIGKKWMALIIYTLMKEPKRFSEIHTFIPDLSKRMLTERMKELEDTGIVIRNVIPDRPVRIEYSLTRKGNDLGTALQAVEGWAEKWL
ncbi:winged helix-turn-helix transcriptional regulator [Sporosarcina sp. NPDC096371]|uniref:winged helix-turn-helix transcriptional regulator n=1 Tax=Sporosarcina sp. NPDC096371 TaxID=3364530 RepID=UPI0037FCC9FB